MSGEGSLHGFVSVPVCFTARWRVAEEPDKLAREIINHRTSDRFTAPPPSFTELPEDMMEMAEFKRANPHLFRMWMALEKKMDYVISLLSSSAKKDEQMGDALCMAVSEGGLKFQVQQPPKIGDKVQTRLTFPSYPMLTIEALAQVTGVEPSVDPAGEFVVTGAFTAINHMDKEDMIQYLFKRQREILQKKRE
ncbi:MAG: PilZ domain-containing protein [Nitrospinae bacterium]|nr:PilZ domain-containing protein [Nitrospinota bacterium]